VHIAVSASMTAVFLAVCLAVVWAIFRSGYRLKAWAGGAAGARRGIAGPPWPVRDCSPWRLRSTMRGLLRPAAV